VRRNAVEGNAVEENAVEENAVEENNVLGYAERPSDVCSRPFLSQQTSQCATIIYDRSL
jgi:hypothetical protein